MKKTLYLILILLKFSNQNIIAQNKLNRLQAEKSVNKYMSKKYKKYNSLRYGELFQQYSSKEIEEKLNTNTPIVYSIIHSYNIKNDTTINMYFHLDENYNVIGYLTDKEMDKIMQNKVGNKLDSIMNSLIPNSAPSR